MNTHVGKKINDLERSHLLKVRQAFLEFVRVGEYEGVGIDTISALDTVRKLLGSLESYRKANGRNESIFEQAAFRVYWMVKIKPLYLLHGNITVGEIEKDHPEYFDGKYNAINENFAFGQALDMLDVEPTEVGDDMRERFIDTLYNGNLDPAHLALSLKLLFDIVAATKRTERAETWTAKAKRLLGLVTQILDLR